MPYIPRTITARMLERYIFNFRLPPDALDERLPATWLRPQEFNGWAVASFCVLVLDRITVWPVPPLFNVSTVSCAYRCGAVDTSGSAPEPTVYITDRNTDRSLVTYLAPLFLQDTIPVVKAAVATSPSVEEISISHLDGQRIFSADVTPASTPGTLKSEVFDSLDAFAAFIRFGVSSWTPSIRPGCLARVDMAKDDTHYAACGGHVDYNGLESLWRDAGMELDSIVKTTAGSYRWTYRGLMAADKPEHSAPPAHPDRATIQDFA